MEWPKGMINSSLTIDLEDLAAEFEEDKYRLFIEPSEDMMNVEVLSPVTGNAVQLVRGAMGNNGNNWSDVH